MGGERSKICPGEDCDSQGRGGNASKDENDERLIDEDADEQQMVSSEHRKDI